MNIVIVEEELAAADSLKSLILETEPQARVEKVLSSVKDAIAYFSIHTPPDLIFSDIRLGGNLCIGLFLKTDLRIPVVFCTAYDEYIVDVLKANGIQYILKPFSRNEIGTALKKCEMMHSIQSSEVSVNTPMREDRPAKIAGRASILVYRKDKIIPVNMDNIALFYRKNDITHLLTFDRNTFFVSWALDRIQQLDNGDFYRANRQYIVHRNAVHSLSRHLERKLTVHLTVPFVGTVFVSKKKAASFLKWLES